jgi:integrase
MNFEQLLRLLEECRSPHRRLFVVLAISTGQRKTAILELTWDRVDLDLRGIDFLVDRNQDDILDSGGRKGLAKFDTGDLAFHALAGAKRWRTTDYVIEYNGKPVKDIHKALKAAMVRTGVNEKFFGAMRFDIRERH